MSDWLSDEMWRSVERVRQQHLDRLVALGCGKAAIASLGTHQPPFGVARVEWLSNGFYQSIDGGVPAVITPVWDRLVGDVVDLIAWTTSEPRRWSWRTGHGLALGLDQLDYGKPVPVVQSPLAWLSVAGEALCVLDWSIPSPLWAQLRSATSLTFRDDALRQRLRNALVTSAQLPTMEIHRDAA